MDIAPHVLASAVGKQECPIAAASRGTTGIRARMISSPPRDQIHAMGALFRETGGKFLACAPTLEARKFFRRQCWGIDGQGNRESALQGGTCPQEIPRGKLYQLAGPHP